MIKPNWVFTRSLSALVITLAMAVQVQTATAQTAGNLRCNGCVDGKDIKNNGIKGKDIKDGQVKGADLNANLFIGTRKNDGDLGVKNVAGKPTVSLDGATGNITNLFANAQASSNGLVKAWAKINGDGTVDRCWRCNIDPVETNRAGKPGTYEVDFTPLSTDISGRPRSVVLDRKSENTDGGEIELSDRSGDASSVLVRTYDSGGTSLDKPFTVMIY